MLETRVGNEPSENEHCELMSEQRPPLARDRAPLITVHDR
jgi:hypothetical protein